MTPSTRTDYTSNPIIRSNQAEFMKGVIEKLKWKYGFDTQGYAGLGIISQMEGSEGFISGGSAVTLQTIGQAIVGQQNQDWGGWAPFKGRVEVNPIKMLESFNKLGDLQNLFGKLSQAIPKGGKLNIPIPKEQNALWNEWRSLRAIEHLQGDTTTFEPYMSSLWGANVWGENNLLARNELYRQAQGFAEDYSQGNAGFLLPLDWVETQDGYGVSDKLTPWTNDKFESNAETARELIRRYDEKFAAGGLSRGERITMGVQYEQLKKFKSRMDAYTNQYPAATDIWMGTSDVNSYKNE